MPTSGQRRGGGQSAISDRARLQTSPWPSAGDSSTVKWLVPGTRALVMISDRPACAGAGVVLVL